MIFEKIEKKVAGTKIMHHDTVETATNTRTKYTAERGLEIEMEIARTRVGSVTGTIDYNTDGRKVRRDTEDVDKDESRPSDDEDDDEYLDTDEEDKLYQQLANIPDVMSVLSSLETMNENNEEGMDIGEDDIGDALYKLRGKFIPNYTYDSGGEYCEYGSD